MFKIKYQKDKGIFYIILSNKLDYTQTIDYLNLICNTKINCQNITIITDYRNAILNETSPQPIEKIANFVNTKLKSKYNKIKWGSISIDYMFTTGAMILMNLVTDKNLSMQPFTTIDGLLNWTQLTNDDLDELVLLYESN